MDGLATYVARRAQRTALANRQHDKELGTRAPERSTEHVAIGTGPPKTDGPIEAITSGVRGPP